MKKVFVLSNYSRSLVNFRGDMIRMFIDNGFSVSVGAPHIFSDQVVVDWCERLGVGMVDMPMDRTGTNLFEDVKTAMHIRKILKALKPDYLIAYTLKPVVYGSIASYGMKDLKVTCMITGVGSAFLKSVSLKQAVIQGIVKLLYRLALFRADKVLFQNVDNKNLFESLNLVSSDKADLINGSGVNVERFKYHPFKFSGKVVFLMTARLLKSKGIREYFQAAQYISERYDNVEFHYVGWLDNNPDAITKDELDGWIQQGYINFVGELDDVLPPIVQSSVFVLPSLAEGIPRTVLEAMSVGRAIITTDAPGCRATVVPNENGLLIPLRNNKVDYMDLVSAMKYFIENPDQLRLFGDCSREIAVDVFSVERVNADILSHMKEM